MLTLNFITISNAIFMTDIIYLSSQLNFTMDRSKYWTKHIGHQNSYILPLLISPHQHNLISPIFPLTNHMQKSSNPTYDFHPHLNHSRSNHTASRLFSRVAPTQLSIIQTKYISISAHIYTPPVCTFHSSPHARNGEEYSETFISLSPPAYRTRVKTIRYHNLITRRYIHCYTRMRVHPISRNWISQLPAGAREQFVADCAMARARGFDFNRVRR